MNYDCDRSEIKTTFLKNFPILLRKAHTLRSFAAGSPRIRDGKHEATTRHPHHALAVADDVLLMLAQTEFACGPAEEVLSEKNVRALYGVDLKRITFEHGGKTVQTLVPVIPSTRARINGAS